MDLERLCLDRLGMSLDEVVEYILRKTKPPGAGTPDGSKRKTERRSHMTKTLYHKKKIRARAAALILAGGVLLGGSVLGGRGTAQAVEDEGPSVLGYLVIPAKLREAERPVRTHDKRTVSKTAERVEIEDSTQGEVLAKSELLTEPEPILRYLGEYRITGYDICVSCCGNTRGITASGTTATVGRTCAAPKDLPFGTRLWIEGIGERVVEDRGGAVHGKKLDILCTDHPACYAITGTYEVYIISEEAQK